METHNCDQKSALKNISKNVELVRLEVVSLHEKFDKASINNAKIETKVKTLWSIFVGLMISGGIALASGLIGS